MRLKLNRKRRHPIVQALFLLLALTLLTGCTAVPAPESTPEATATPAPQEVYAAEFADAGSYTAGLRVLGATERGFYCAETVKTGEDIPESVIREAQKKKTEVKNDGRYDVIAEKLWLITPSGRARELKNYTPLPAEENTGGWKSFGSESSLVAVSFDSDGQLETLECVTVSGNSVPASAAQYDPNKNYYEYRTTWYLRKLSGTGKELSSRSISEEEAQSFRKACAGASVADTLTAEALDQTGICAENVISPVRIHGSGISFLIREDASGEAGADATTERISAVTVRQELRTAEEAPVTLTLAAAENSQRLSRAVAAFNRSQDEVRITLLTDEAAQNADADLRVVTAEEYRSLARTGALENLYPYIDRDRSLKRSLFFTNILKALEVNGGLYETCAGFSIDTALAYSERTGDDAGWTYDELLGAWSAQGIGTDAFDVTTTRSEVLRACLEASMERLVNGEGGSCSFCGEEFRQILSFARNFRASFDPASGWTGGDAADLRVRSGRQLLLTQSIYNMTDAALAGYEFSGEFSYKGYPTLEGTGNLLTVSTLDAGENIAMSSTCTDKDAAWQFLRTFFLADYAEEYLYFPVRKDVFEQQLEEAMEFSYVLDKDGEIMTQKSGEPMIISTGEIYLSDWTTVYLYPISETKAAKLKNLVASASAVRGMYEGLIDILVEDCEPFFLEQATLEEACARAQADAEAYLKE